MSEASDNKVHCNLYWLCRKTINRVSDTLN